MNLKPLLQLCLLVVTISIRNIYSSEFNVISTTLKPTDKPQTSQEDVAKLCFGFVENKLQGITYLLEIIRKENKEQLQKIETNFKKQLLELENKLLTKIEEKEQEVTKKLQEQFDKNEKQLLNLESKLETKTEEKKALCKKQQQEEMLKIQTQLQQLETTINKHEENDSFCKKRQDELSEVINSRLPPENCQDIKHADNISSGVYTIRPKNSDKYFDVLCDFRTRGGNWTYILNRYDGSQDFFLNWTDYKNGFGLLTEEFWLGLQNIYVLTEAYQKTELFIELVDWDNVKKYALYDNFKLGNEIEKYTLKIVGKYSGDSGDALRRHVGNSFSTKDKSDLDGCAKTWKGAWWYYKGCYQSHLTGPYWKKNIKTGNSGIEWYHFHGFNYSLKEARMMIRPRKL